MINKKSIITKRNIRIICIILVFVGFILIHMRIQSFLSPFKTEEEKELKGIYQASMEGVSDFCLSSIFIDEQRYSVHFNLKLKNYTGAEYYTETQLESINRVVEQLVDCLNTKDNLGYKYSYLGLQFNIGHLPVGITCWIFLKGDQYFFNSMLCECGNTLEEFYMMRQVQFITTYVCDPIVEDEEKIDQLSELKELKEIHFMYNVDKESSKWFTNRMKTILPNCKVFIKDDEVL